MGKVLGSVKKYFTAPQEENARTNNFNAMRLIASLMVIYGHMSAIMGMPQHLVLGQKVSSIGVKIFFVLSGYFITKSYFNDSNFLRYTIRRVFRIFPALITVTFFCAFIVGPIFTSLPVRSYLTHSATREFLKNILLKVNYNLPGVFENYTYANAVNGSLWSLPVEFSLYFILPLFVVIFKKLKCVRGGILALALISLGCDIYVHSSTEVLRFVVWGSNLPDWATLYTFFFVGSFMSFPEFKKYFNLQLATAFLACAALISLSFTKTEILLVLVLPYFVLSFGLAEKPVFGAWFTKNDYSYGLYLYGFVIQQIVFNNLKQYNLSLNVLTVICFAITFVFAFLSWHIIEKPSQKIAKKLLEKLKTKEA